MLDFGVLLPKKTRKTIFHSMLSAKPHRVFRRLTLCLSATKKLATPNEVREAGSSKPPVRTSKTTVRCAGNSQRFTFGATGRAAEKRIARILGSTWSLLKPTTCLQMALSSRILQLLQFSASSTRRAPKSARNISILSSPNQASARSSGAFSWKPRARLGDRMRKKRFVTSRYPYLESVSRIFGIPILTGPLTNPTSQKKHRKNVHIPETGGEALKCPRFSSV